MSRERNEDGKLVKAIKWVSWLVVCFSLLLGCSLLEEEQNIPPAATEDAELDEQYADEFAELAAYLKEHGSLPDHYLTKAQAREKGWVPEQGNLHEVAPGMSIGGDRFYNREGRLPDQPGRKWYEADVNYESGHRGPDRIVYSSDGLIYKTEDHYNTFEQLE